MPVGTETVENNIMTVSVQFAISAGHGTTRCRLVNIGRTTIVFGCALEAASFETAKRVKPVNRPRKPYQRAPSSPSRQTPSTIA